MNQDLVRPSTQSGKYGQGKLGTGRKIKRTTPVEWFKLANNFGLYDMHGNLWEWCLDEGFDHYREDHNYNKVPTNGSPRGNISRNETTKRVLRGGSWNANPDRCRSASRMIGSSCPSRKANQLGFRVVCEIPRTLEPDFLATRWLGDGECVAEI